MHIRPRLNGVVCEKLDIAYFDKGQRHKVGRRPELRMLEPTWSIVVIKLLPLRKPFPETAIFIVYDDELIWYGTRLGNRFARLLVAPSDIVAIGHQHRFPTAQDNEPSACAYWLPVEHHQNQPDCTDGVAIRISWLMSSPKLLIYGPGRGPGGQGARLPTCPGCLFSHQFPLPCFACQVSTMKVAMAPARLTASAA